MKIIKGCRSFKIICFMLIVTFISLDMAYAYPPENIARNSTLAAPSALQQQPVNEHAALFQQSVFSRAVLLASILDIGKYFFGDAKYNIGPLPADYAEDAVNADLKKHLNDAGIEILKIVPIEYIHKQAGQEKLKSALDEIGFKWTLPDHGVVFILYKKDGKKFLVQVARKDQVSPNSLPGYEWVVSEQHYNRDEYVIKYIPEDYDDSSTQVAQ